MRKFFWIGLVALLSGCYEDIANNRGDANGTILELNAVINQQYVTRASDGGFGDGDQIGVFIVNYENGEPQHLKVNGNYADNVRFTYNDEDGKWTGSNQLYWKDKSTHADAYSYYPYDAELNNVDAYPFTIQRNQSVTVQGKSISGYEASDFLWAKVEDVASGNPIYLKHHHIMAGIEVTLVEGEYFENGEWNALEKSVQVDNTMLNTTIDFSAGEVSLVTSSGSASVIPLRHSDQWRAIVAPQTVAADKSLLAITVDGTSYHFQRSEAMTYYPGKLHKFTIQVDKHLPEGDYQFSLLSEAITPWENDVESHNGTAKEYIVVHIEKGQYIEDVIKNMGLDPESIINLKITGIMSSKDNWENNQEDTTIRSNLYYIRHSLPHLESLNLRDLHLVELNTYYSVRLNEYVEYENRKDEIPYRAFYGIESLRSIEYPTSLIRISNEAFLGTGLRGSCILPEGLESIGDAVYSPYFDGRDYYYKAQCHMTGDLYIPSTCRSIGGFAFYGQDFSNELILPEHMNYLGEQAFGHCKYMTGYLNIPKGLETIYNSWEGMRNLKGWAEVPDGTKIVNGIGCSISSLSIPEGVTELNGIWSYNYARDIVSQLDDQKHRKKLKEVFLPSSIRILGGATFAGTSISKIKLPESLEYIKECCFYNCHELQDTLYLPNSLFKIEQCAFYNCTQLKAIVFPKTTISVEQSAFANCYSLNYIQCLGSIPPQISEAAFYGVEKTNVTLVVPQNAVDAYRNAPGWCEFKRISADYNFVCRPMQDKLLNKGHDMPIVLNADGNWTMTHCPSWAHVSKTTGYKKTKLTITVDNLAHGAGNRNDSIVFTLTDKADEEGKPITCYYKLSQYDYQYDEDSEFIIQQATRGNGKVNIFICGDGYDAQDIAEGTYLTDMRQEMEYFFDVEPYKTYKDYFNVYTGFALSRESGINSTNKWRETKFETLFGNGCHDVRLTSNFDKAMLYSLDISPQIIPDGNAAPLIILLANTDYCDGITRMYGDNSAVAVCTKSTLDYPHDARGIVQHEAGGHGFGKLADEYIYHNSFIQKCGCQCCEHVPELLSMKSMGWARNLSLSGKYKDIEWQQLIFDLHYDDICDIYEGGYFHARGVYRSEVNSCMNNNVPYFSTVSRMAIVERIKQYAGETFNYDDFVAHDCREYGSKFLTRGQSAPSEKTIGSGMHFSAPILNKGTVRDLLKKNRKK